MTQFNAIGEYGLNDVLTKRLTTPGGSNSPSVAPEIFPCLALESDRPEWAHLKGELLWGKYDSVAAVAAQVSAFQLYLPTTARTVAVITRIVNKAATAVTVARLVGIGGSIAGWAGRTVGHRDTGDRGEGTSLILERVNNVAAPTQFASLTALVALNDYYDAPLVIRPGGSIGIIAQAVNTTITLAFEGYERPAQPGELV